MKRLLISLCTITACTGDTGGGADTPDAGGQNHPDAAPSGNCPSAGAALADLPVCQDGTLDTLDVPAGCTPTIDGTLHADEWQDASCRAFIDGDDVAYFKHDADNLYIAFSAPPTCGCAMAFMFDPDPTTSGDEYALGLFDDPFGTDGDRFDQTLTSTGWVNGTAPAGIVTRCPGSEPPVINYEISVPLSAIDAVHGASHTFGFAVQHNGVGWPDTVAGGNLQSTDPTAWGQISASSW